MRILIVSQQYWPENWRIVDAAEELVHRGHQVVVVCGVPNDHNGELIEKYRDPQFWNEVHNGVRLIRVFDHPRKHGDFSLYKKYMSFVKKANRAVDGLAENFDIVFINQLSPVMQAIPGLRYARKWGKPTLMYCYDLWPESLAARNVVNHGLTKPIYRHYLRLSRRLYNGTDRILVTSPDYLSYLHDRCLVPADHMAYLPQYAEDLFATKAAANLSQATAHNFVFAGNVGKAQGLDCILELAKSCLDQKNCHFFIIGTGSDKERLVQKAKDMSLSNLLFCEPIPKSLMPVLYSRADSVIVALKNGSMKDSIPSKLYEVLAFGIPTFLIASGDAVSLLQETKIGLAVDPDLPKPDLVQSFSIFLSKLSSYQNQKDRCAELIKNNYSRSVLAKQFVTLVTEQFSLDQ